MNPWERRFSDRMAHVRASEIRELLKLLDQPDILSFAGGIPDPALFPVERIAGLYAEVLADAGPQALQYSVSEGLAPLRRWIAERMTAADAPCDESNIVITAGSQQALDLIGKLFLGGGDTVLADRPTYMGALGAFNAYEPRYADLAGEAGGRLAYVVPDFANPTGRTMTRSRSTGRRRRISSSSRTPPTASCGSGAPTSRRSWRWTSPARAPSKPPGRSTAAPSPRPCRRRCGSAGSARRGR